MITLKKVKLKGRKISLDYFKPVEGGTDTISVKCANQVHPDLIKAVDKLIPHFILLCELPEATGLTIDLMANNIEDVDSNDFPKIQVDGFSIGGDDEDEGLTIIGSRLLSKGKSLNINSPFTKYDTEEYPYADELNLVIQEIQNEVEEFLNGKISNRQLDMFEDTNANADDPFVDVEITSAIGEVLKPKKGKKKKEVEQAEPAA